MKASSIRIMEGIIIGVVVAIATTLINRWLVVQPVKQDRDAALESVQRLQQKLDQYKYGEVVDSIKVLGLHLRVERVERLDTGTIRVRILADNLEEQPRPTFTVRSKDTAAQTETLKVAPVARMQVFNSGVQTNWNASAPLTRLAKHVPIVLEFDGLDDQAGYLSSLTLDIWLGHFANQQALVSFHDLEIL